MTGKGAFHWLFFLLGFGLLLPGFTFLNSLDYFGFAFEDYLANGCVKYPHKSTMCHGRVVQTLPYKDSVADACPAPLVASGKVNAYFVVAYYSANLMVYLPVYWAGSKIMQPMVSFVSWGTIILAITALPLTFSLHLSPSHLFHLSVGAITIVGCMAGLLNAIIFGLASRQGTDAVQHTLLGLAFSPIVNSIIKIATKMLAKDVEGGTLVFWGFTGAICILCVAMYGAYLPSSRDEVIVSLDTEEAPLLTGRDMALTETLTLWELFRQIKLRVFVVFFTFFISLTVFAFQFRWFTQHITLWPKSSCVADPSWFNIMSLFCWNLGDLMGRFLPNYIILFERERSLAYASVARVVLVPLFLMVTPLPSAESPRIWVLRSDFVCFALSVLGGISNGYIGTLGMLVAGRDVPQGSQTTVGVLLSFALVLGLALGSVTNTFLLTPLVDLI